MQTQDLNREIKKKNYLSNFKLTFHLDFELTYTCTLWVRYCCRKKKMLTSSTLNQIRNKGVYWCFIDIELTGNLWTIYSSIFAIQEISHNNWCLWTVSKHLQSSKQPFLSDCLEVLTRVIWPQTWSHRMPTPLKEQISWN